MQVEVFEGKEEKEVLELALESLGVEESEILYYTEKEKVGLLKKEVVKVYVATLENIIKFIKEIFSKLKIFLFYKRIFRGFNKIYGT